MFIITCRRVLCKSCGARLLNGVGEIWLHGKPEQKTAVSEISTIVTFQIVTMMSDNSFGSNFVATFLMALAS